MPLVETRSRDMFAYHSDRARCEILAALAAKCPGVAAVHVELASQHVRLCRDFAPPG